MGSSVRHGVRRRGEVVAMERYASAPGFEEYVEARGVDLLRTAWLLSGSEEAARRLAAATLARAWPRWRRLAEVGAGAYDAELRRVLVAEHLRRHDRSPAGEVHRTGPDPGDGRVLRALLELSRPDRARVVLSLFDGLGDAQVGEAFGEPLATAHRRRDTAVRRLGAATGLGAEALGAALERLAPPSPDLDGLVRAPTGRGPSRTRRLVGWAGAAAVLVGAVVVAASVAAPRLGSPAPPTPTPTRSVLASADCQRRHDAPDLPAAGRPGAQGDQVAAVVVCARTDNDSVWTGYLPPSQAVTDPRAVAMLVLDRRDAGTGCGDVPSGPAFRVLVESLDGHVATYPNESLRCNGWPALDSFYRAVAEQDAVRAQSRWDDGFLTCPPVFDPSPAVTSARPLPRGSRFDTATLCLHPLPVPGHVPRMRPVTRLVLAQSQVAQLDADLAAEGSTHRRRPVCRGSNALFVVRARTVTGRVVDLAGACPDSLGVDFDRREWLRLPPTAAAMVRTGLDVSYR